MQNALAVDNAYAAVLLHLFFQKCRDDLIILQQQKNDFNLATAFLNLNTVPDGDVGILPAFMMVDAGCHYVDFC